MLNVTADTQICLQDKTARILVVEEEPSVAIMLDEALSDFGYHVLGPVENLKAAVYLAEMEHIDAAVVDSNIDGRIAEAVTDKLMERGIPFVFVDSHTRIFSSPYCAMPLLKRPFTADDLHRAIMRLLRQNASGLIQQSGFFRSSPPTDVSLGSKADNPSPAKIDLCPLLVQ